MIIFGVSGFVYSMYFEVKYYIVEVIMLTCIIVEAIISLLSS